MSLPHLLRNTGLFVNLLLLMAWAIPGVAVVQGNPQVNLSTNQSIQQGTQNNQVDGWVGAILPDGSRVFLQSDLVTFGSTPAPTAQNFMAIDFSGPLYQLQLPNVLPPGTYTFFAVGVFPGTDPFEASNHVTNVATAAVTLSEAFKVSGLNFSPYINGQDPNLGSYVDEGQLMTRMEIIGPYTEWIRTFSSTNGLEKSGTIAHVLGLKAALGAWIGADLVANEREIENLIAAAKAGDADMLIVGSEVLLRGDLSEEAVIDYINRVKQAVPEVPVSYADVYGILLSHPNVMDAVDFVLVNYSIPIGKGLVLIWR